MKKLSDIQQKISVQKSTVFIVAAAVFIFMLVVAGGTLYKQKSAAPLVFSDRLMMENIWHFYTQEYLEPITWRTMDKQRDFITTSEGQSYTMLRAVWADDRKTFDRSWEWTKNHLAREEDNLFAWKFGKQNDETWGILHERGGYNTASDANTYIALALIFASAKWNNPSYAEEALPIIEDIWEYEVVTILGRPYLVASDVEKKIEKSAVTINPSYFSPYAYRIFARLDPSHDWNGLVDSSYDVLLRSTVLTLDKEKSAHLPPDWIKMDKRTGEIFPVESDSATTNFGFDALRIPMKLALDHYWNGDPRALDMLRTFRFLATEWQTREKLYSTYAHDGVPVYMMESPSMYAGALGYFMVFAPDDARYIYEKKLRSLYDPDSRYWERDIGYYSDNLVWFAMGLYNGTLVNIYQNILAGT